MKQHELIFLNKHTALPNELSVDIFKTISTVPYEIIKWKIEINNNPTLIIQKLYKYWWNNYVGNILKSSSIIYINISKAFRERKKMAQVPNSFVFNGLEYEPEVNFWNLTANISVQLNQECLMNRQGHRLNLLKNAIIKHVENEKKPHTNIPLFKICGNESKLLSVRENFNMLLIDEGETSVRSSAYYINKDICVRHWIFGNIPGILQRGIKNFVAYGDVYAHLTNMNENSACGNQLIIVRTYSANELFGNSQMNLFTNESHDAYSRENNKQPSHTIHTNERLSVCVKSFADNLLQGIGLNTLSSTTKDNFPIMYPYLELSKHYKGRSVDVAAYGIIDQHILDNTGKSERVGWICFFGLIFDKII